MKTPYLSFIYENVMALGFGVTVLQIAPLVWLAPQWRRSRVRTVEMLQVKQCPGKVVFGWVTPRVCLVGCFKINENVGTFFFITEAFLVIINTTITQVVLLFKV